MEDSAQVDSLAAVQDTLGVQQPQYAEVTITAPDDSTQIWVNREGKVTRAEFQPKGSSTTNGNLVNKAKEAALKASFNPDSSAPEEQKGTITYLFTI